MLNENLPVHVFVDPSQWRRESWFKMLTKLASLPKLAILRLHGAFVLCPEFFRAITEHEADEPFPALVEFELQFAAETADGRWFYERDSEAIEASQTDPEHKEFWEHKNDEDARQQRYIEDTASDYADGYVSIFEDEPLSTGLALEDRFRSLPNRATFLPFLLDAAEAAMRIPNLQKFVLKQGDLFASPSDLDYYPIVTRMFEVCYLKAGMPRSWKEGTGRTIYDAFPRLTADAIYVNRDRLYWRVDRWRPWDEVHAAWGALLRLDEKIVFLKEDLFARYRQNSSLLLYEAMF
jgi:hypothetical protein